MMKKNVFITGASRRLGVELSRHFSGHGYFVYAGSFSRDAELFGPDKVIRGDISNEADVRRMFSEIGQLDVLINNARFDLYKRKEGSQKRPSMYCRTSRCPTSMCWNWLRSRLCFS